MEQIPWINSYFAGKGKLIIISINSNDFISWGIAQQSEIKLILEYN